MPLPRLPLRPWTGEILPPTSGEVLWIGEPVIPALGRLADRLDEERRRFVVTPRFVPTPAEPPGNPWAWRPHEASPIRWNEDGCDRLEHLPDAPESFGALVLGGVLGGKGDHDVRALLIQIAPRLALDAPFVCVEPNGRYAGAVVRSMRGQGHQRSVEELRRLLEVSGFGLSGAFAYGGESRVRRVVGRLAPDAGARWMIVRGRRALREGKLPTGRARWTP